jgi:hypothetical protein
VFQQSSSEVQGSIPPILVEREKLIQAIKNHFNLFDYSRWQGDELLEEIIELIEKIDG